MWKDVTSPSEIEDGLIARNRRHSQQLSMENGPAMGPIITGLLDKYGTSKDAIALMAGEYTTAHPVSPALASWFSHMAQTDPEKNSPWVPLKCS